MCDVVVKGSRSLSHLLMSSCLANLNSLYAVACPSVVCLSETLVHPTQAVVIFGNISTAFGTLAIRWYSWKILRRSSQGNPSVRGVKHKRVTKYSDFGPIEGYISETVRIGGKLVLIINRKWQMSFRLVRKLVTLNDFEQRHGRYFALFQGIR